MTESGRKTHDDMTMSPASRVLDRVKQLVRAFRDARSGAGAVEFAILAPILLMLYIGAFEITVGMSVAKRASRAAGTIADLVTQTQGDVNKAKLDAMKSVASSIFVPYTPNNLKLKISGISISAAGVPTIAWSWQQDGTKPYGVGAVVTLPADLKNPSSFLVHAELQVDHKLGMFLANTMSATTSTIQISRDFYFRQRLGDKIGCTDC